MARVATDVGEDWLPRVIGAVDEADDCAVADPQRSSSRLRRPPSPTPLASRSWMKSSVASRSSARPVSHSRSPGKWRRGQAHESGKQLDVVLVICRGACRTFGCSGVTLSGVALNWQFGSPSRSFGNISSATPISHCRLRPRTGAATCSELSSQLCDRRVVSIDVEVSGNTQGPLLMRIGRQRGLKRAVRDVFHQAKPERWGRNPENDVVAGQLRQNLAAGCCNPAHRTFL